jgi:hypothetical protein
MGRRFTLDGIADFEAAARRLIEPVDKRVVNPLA